MISRENRLTAKRHFKKVYDKGAKFNGELFVCRYLKILTNSPSRVSIVISKKTAPNAVDRNLIRRRYKAVLRDEIKSVKGVDFIFTPKKGKEQSYLNIKADISKCLKSLQ